jgi:soluble lytic murein transglycosylase
MRMSTAMLGLTLSALLGVVSGAIAAEERPGVSVWSTFSAWVRPSQAGSKVHQLEAELKTLRQRSTELDALHVELQGIATRLERQDGTTAFDEAKRLGIVDAVAKSMPTLRPSAVRRMSVALVLEAKRNNLDPLLLAAVARVESGFNPFATSGAGARGLLQLTPVTGRALSEVKGEKLNGDAELYDIETNVSLGAQYLSALVRQFRSVDAALLAYNRGIGGARLVLKTADAQKYLQGYPKAVLKERQRLSRWAARGKNSGPVSL